MPTSSSRLTSSTTAAASAGGAPLRRRKATGGHRTVASSRPSRIGSRTTHSWPAMYQRTTSAAQTSRKRRLIVATRAKAMPTAASRRREASGTSSWRLTTGAAWSASVRDGSWSCAAASDGCPGSGGAGAREVTREVTQRSCPLQGEGPHARAGEHPSGWSAPARVAAGRGPAPRRPARRPPRPAAGGRPDRAGPGPAPARRDGAPGLAAPRPRRASRPARRSSCGSTAPAATPPAACPPSATPPPVRARSSCCRRRPTARGTC
jgi:hypothetical protein